MQGMNGFWRLAAASVAFAGLTVAILGVPFMGSFLALAGLTLYFTLPHDEDDLE